jgi:DNA polymerase V
MEEKRVYVCIDLKSFYASVECVERGLDPLDTCLLVADASRTDRTICLAVSPPLKALGVPGRPRLFEAVRKVQEINEDRRTAAPRHRFRGKSYLASELKANPALQLTWITAVPRMKLYMDYSRRVYEIYLKYLAPEDIHVYSIDEVMMDITPYLTIYGVTPYILTKRIIKDVLATTGITATGGIGTNLYLSKVAMDIVAKGMKADASGVRIAALDEASYRRQLWEHRPLTDFWRIGPATARHLEAHGLYTMGDIARLSVMDDSLLYRLFGINAELLIDHAWGWEPCRMEDIKQYRPKNNSLGSGQVLPKPYTAEKARMIVWEMTEQLVLDLVDKKLVTDEVVLTLGYDHQQPDGIAGPLVIDAYGRTMPPHAHGSSRLGQWTASEKLIQQHMMALFDHIIYPYYLVRRVTVTAAHVQPARQAMLYTVPSLFAEDPLTMDGACKEQQLQETVVALQHRFGKNALLKGRNLCADARTITRNGQVGGHRA